MKTLCGFLLLCLLSPLAGAAECFDVISVEGGNPNGPWGIWETRGGGIVIGQAVSFRCFRFGNGRKIVRDEAGGLHVVYVDPYPPYPYEVPPADGPYSSCTYVSSADGWQTIETTYLDNDFFSRFPAIAIHGDTLHVIYANWESYTSYSNIEYTRSTDLGETWTEPINITPTEYLAGDCDYAGLDVDLDGNPHVSFVWPDNQAVYWTMSPDGGDTWNTPEQVSYGQPNGTVSFTNVYINPHTNQPHIVFTADGLPDFYGDKNYYHTFYLDGLWSFPTENVTRHPAGDAHCYGCGTLIFDADTEEYTAYLFVDDQSGGPKEFYHGIGVYRRTDFSTNLGEDGSIWGNPITVATDSEPQFESRPWYPSVAINPGSDPTSASDDTVFCVFASGQGGQEEIGDIFIRYSTDKGLTWLNDWHRNPLTTDGDLDGDNWPEVDWGHWHPGHLDVVWVAVADTNYEVQYADAYVIEVPFVRGDVQADGDFDLYDAIYGLHWLGGLLPAPSCIKTVDVQDDGDVDIFDAIQFLNWLGGIEPPPSAPCCGIPGDCGTDPTPDVLSCNSYAPCASPELVGDKTTTVGSAEASLLAMEGWELDGESVVVPVTVTNAEPLVALGFTVEYDPQVLVATAVENSGSITEEFPYFVGGVDEPGVVNVIGISDLDMGDGVDRLPAGTHEIARIVFQRKTAGRDISLKVINSVMAVDHLQALNHQTRVESIVDLPSDFELSQNYPNPFNADTEIAYALPQETNVKLTVFNLLGQRVRALVHGIQPAGRHVVSWEGRDDEGNPMASGVYFCRLEVEDRTQVRRMLLLK